MTSQRLSHRKWHQIASVIALGGLLICASGAAADEPSGGEVWVPPERVDVEEPRARGEQPEEPGESGGMSLEEISRMLLGSSS